jgi:hypothetical protein
MADYFAFTSWGNEMKFREDRKRINLTEMLGEYHPWKHI